MKQFRVRFSGVGEEDQYPTTTPTFRQGQMNTDGINEAAIAAAAFAIMSREEEVLIKQKQKEEARTPLSRTKSGTEEIVKKPIFDAGTGSSKFVRWLSGKDAREDSKAAGAGTLARSSTTERQKQYEESGRTPSFRKTPTFPNNYQNEETSKRFDKKQRQEIQPVPNSDKPLGLSSNNRMKGPLPGETKADAWEREKMAKIRESFEKLNLTILEWENKKKTKAKRKLARKERELEQRRSNAQTEYREEETRINKIVAGARALAEERKRNDEAKTIEKARKMRSAQQSPKSSCPCF
ncbi:hypothetical protein LUZ60_005906 [Juncus effusus]|nr:hypothetical protein LUZ60_005906 [Juncus effusus]